MIYSQILKGRKSTQYGSLIFVGHPFDRSTAMLSAEIRSQEKAFVIDMTGKMADQNIGDFICLRDKNLSDKIDLCAHNKIIVDLSSLEPEKREHELLAALSQSKNRRIYIIGLENVSKELISLFNFCSEIGLQIICSVNNLQWMDPDDFQYVHKVFPEMIIAGRKNIARIKDKINIDDRDAHVIYINFTAIYNVADPSKMEEKLNSQNVSSFNMNILLQIPVRVIPFRQVKNQNTKADLVGVCVV